MAPPSQLAITTSSVLRLVKEESTYHAELAQQEARVAELQQGGGAVAEDGENAEYMLKQEVRGHLPPSKSSPAPSTMSFLDLRFSVR